MAKGVVLSSPRGPITGMEQGPSTAMLVGPGPAWACLSKVILKNNTHNRAAAGSASTPRCLRACGGGCNNTGTQLPGLLVHCSCFTMLP